MIPLASPVTAFIALGANLDDPLMQIRGGIEALAALPESRLLAISSLYRTAPVDVGETQPDYVNAVLSLETSLAPDALLAELLAIETRRGRSRETPLAARRLDLDLLLYGDATIDVPGLHVPHPRMHLRAFVLVPLLEIEPDADIPGRGRAALFLPAVSGQSIEKLA